MKSLYKLCLVLAIASFVSTTMADFSKSGFIPSTDVTKVFELIEGSYTGTVKKIEAIESLEIGDKCEVIVSFDEELFTGSYVFNVDEKLEILIEEKDLVPAVAAAIEANNNEISLKTKSPYIKGSFTLKLKFKTNGKLAAIENKHSERKTVQGLIRCGALKRNN